MDPLIYDIQKFSIHNGTGIRTTVFFKGCTMACQWCHNPESIAFEKEMLLDEEACTVCGYCLKVCPSARIIENNKIKRILENCDFCGACTVYCPQECNSIVGRKYTRNELVDELLKDLSFYETSSGGVTFSGGEALCHEGYLKDVILALKAHDINITIDTCGHVPYAAIETLYPLVDTFLYDLKVMDDEKHEAYTQVSNKKVIDNLKKLSLVHEDIIIRVPLIEGVNTDDLNIKALVKLMKSLGLSKIDLLPYHSGGIHKRKQLKMKSYTFNAPSENKIQEIKECFESNNISVRIGG